MVRFTLAITGLFLFGCSDVNFLKSDAAKVKSPTATGSIDATSDITSPSAPTTVGAATPNTTINSTPNTTINSTPSDTSTPGAIGTNGNKLNPNATSHDPSGMGSSVSTNNDGDKPFTGTPIGDSATNPKVVDGAGNPVAGAATALTPAQQTQMKNCLAAWGWHHPFSSKITKPDKIIFGNIDIGPVNRVVDDVLGTTISGITDTEVTAAPSLIMIFAAINLGTADPLGILPDVKYKLYNPNGWYCINFSLDIISDLTIELKKGANLAEGDFDINILSSSPAIANHGLGILARTNVVVVP